MKWCLSVSLLINHIKTTEPLVKLMFADRWPIYQNKTWAYSQFVVLLRLKITSPIAKTINKSMNGLC